MISTIVTPDEISFSTLCPWHGRRGRRPPHAHAAPSTFAPNRASLTNSYRTPDWFRDANFRHHGLA